MIVKVLRRAFYGVIFLGYFLLEVVLANLRVAYDVVTIKHYMRPGIVAVPLEAKTDLEITLLANMISLTPGTLTLDVSSDRKVLFIHDMYMGEIEQLKVFERRLLRVLR